MKRMQQKLSRLWDGMPCFIRHFPDRRPIRYLGNAGYKLPLATVATLVGVGVILQKVIFVSAVAVLGSSGFATLKKKLFAEMAPADEVGPVRYRIGLVMFMLPILQGLVETYASHAAPHLVANRLWVDVAMDIVLIASGFVLGGNVWDKIRALFVREARAVFPEDKAGAIPLRARPVVG